ncbi:MAG: hypothetical protein IKL38_00725 [Firmicutes bacterium]|nr:hypothetical protein [Bacillota bacterium]
MRAKSKIQYPPRFWAALAVAILLLIVLIVEFKMLKKKAGQKAAVQEVDHE